MSEDRERRTEPVHLTMDEASYLLALIAARMEDRGHEPSPAVAAMEQGAYAKILAVEHRLYRLEISPPMRTPTPPERSWFGRSLDTITGAGKLKIEPATQEPPKITHPSRGGRTR